MLIRTGGFRPAVAVGAVALFVCIAFAVLVPPENRSAESAPDGDDGTDGWNAIPPWQYEGCHVESGGISRGEQERALRDVQRQADELSDEPPEE